MDVMRFGGDVRLLRTRRGWTLRRLATEAKVSRWVVAEIEAGRGDRLTAERLIRVIAALGGYLSIRIQYQGEGLDRLRDRRHPALVDQLVERLRSEGWEVATEISFNDFGKRGSMDILAFEPTSGHSRHRGKGRGPGHRGMLATLDRKVRLARGRGVARLAGQDRQPPLGPARGAHGPPAHRGSRGNVSQRLPGAQHRGQSLVADSVEAAFRPSVLANYS
jgi:transcriptional regulator with XRE-family HTH domain